MSEMDDRRRLKIYVRANYCETGKIKCSKKESCKKCLKSLAKLDLVVKLYYADSYAYVPLTEKEKFIGRLKYPELTEYNIKRRKVKWR